MSGGPQSGLDRQGRGRRGLLGGPRPRTCLLPGLERRPPMVTDLDIPGPAKYKVPNASVRESSPHPHFSISRKHLARGAWPSLCAPQLPLGPGSGPCPPTSLPNNAVPTAEGNVHRAWPTVRLQRESPFTPKANGNQEQKVGRSAGRPCEGGACGAGAGPEGRGGRVLWATKRGP